jgi:hypothetical protein
MIEVNSRKYKCYENIKNTDVFGTPFKRLFWKVIFQYFISEKARVGNTDKEQPFFNRKVGNVCSRGVLTVKAPNSKVCKQNVPRYKDSHH